MSFSTESDRRRKPDPVPSSDLEKKQKSGKKRPNAEIGTALRKAYSDAVDEAIPPEMLDLLGKLG
ncbi:MAG TPA: NepR family anti-sigma factor [Allosphingosinicella sp.]